MIVIRIRLKVEAHNKAEFVHFMKEEVARNHTLSGCLAYTLYEDVSVENSFLLYEEWQDRETFNDYKESAEFALIMAKLSPLLAGKPDSAHFEAEIIGP